MPSRKVHQVAATITLLSLVTLGCSESNDSKRVPYSAQLDQNASGQTVSTLDDTSLKQVCANYAGYVDAQVSFDAIAEAVCLIPAIVLGGTTQGCQQRLADCMDLFPQPVSIQAQVQSDALCVDSLRTCSGTVADVEACVNVNIDALLNVLRTLSCNGLDADSQAQANQVMDTLGACGNLDAACTAFTTPTTEAPQ